jgi:hypothetical protein
MMSAWSLGDPTYSHNAYVLPPAMVLFSDRVWNDLPCEYDGEYRRAVYRAVSGDNETSADPYSHFAEILPPRSSTARELTEDVELDKISTNALGDDVKELKTALGKGVYGRRAVFELLSCLERIMDAIDKKDHGGK